MNLNFREVSHSEHILLDLDPFRVSEEHAYHKRVDTFAEFLVFLLRFQEFFNLIDALDDLLVPRVK